MKKYWIIILLIIIIIIQAYFLFKPNNSSISDLNIEKIDSLKSEIDSLHNIRDSIVEKIDTVYVKLNNINIEHEKNVDIIVNNDVNEDYKFFLKYIRSNKNRLDSMYNIH